MKRLLAIGLCFGVLGVLRGRNINPAGLSREEERRMSELKGRLCAVRGLDCAYVLAVSRIHASKFIILPRPASGI